MNPQEPPCGSKMEPQGKAVTVIPRDGNRLSITDKTVIDLMNGTVIIGTTKQDGIDQLCKKAVFLYVNSDGALVFSLEDGNTFRCGASTYPLVLKNYPGGFRKITINHPGSGVTRNVWLVASCDPNFDIPWSTVG